MNKLITRIISGVIGVFSLWVVMFMGFINGPGIDYGAVLIGALFLAVSLVLFFDFGSINKRSLVILGLVVLSFGVGVYFYPQLPEEVASHWNAQGQVDDYMGRFWGAFLMPIVSLVIYLMFLLIPKIDPMKENIKKFRKYFDGFILAIILFLFYIYSLTIFWNLGYRFNFSRYMIPAFAILMYCAGVLISKAEKNWFIGIKTPWTLSNDKVWNKTHKLGGKLFKISAVIILFGLIFPVYGFYIGIGAVVFSSLFLVLYSYLEFKKIGDK